MRFGKLYPLLIAFAVFLSSDNAARGWQTGPDPHLAFTRVEVERSTSEAHPEPFVRTTVKALRSDGSRAEAIVDGQGRYLSRSLTLPAALKNISVHDDIKATTTYFISAERAQALRRRPVSADCSNLNSLMTRMGEDMILGYKTFEFVVSGPGPQGEQATFHNWLAPGLECTSLRDAAEWTTDGRKGQSVKEVVSIKMGDPDPALFEVPADYAEMSPSAVAAARAVATARPVPPRVAEQLRISDQKYFESAKNKPH